VSQSAPGWYQDHDDPRLARWWDGERWTEHTLVLDEQDWSTEPDPPAGATRFPVDTGSVTAVEATPEAGWEDDIYAPIRDPWGDEEPAAAGVDAPTTAWQQPDEPAAWDESTAAAAAIAAAPVATGWDEDRWVTPGGRRPGGYQDWPGWAKIAVPVGALALLLIVLVASGAIGGDDDPVSTSSSSTTQAPSLADAADAALRAAGNGPFTASTFTTLIPLTCDAAEQSDPSMLTERILLLGYDAETISKLIQGLRAGTDEYCPDDMADAPTLLNQVETAALSGGTTSTSTAVTVPATTATTKKPTTATTKKPVTTTKPPVVTTTTAPPVTTTAPPVTTTTAPATTTSTTPPVVDGP
jgi:hypothetical protein